MKILVYFNSAFASSAAIERLIQITVHHLATRGFQLDLLLSPEYLEIARSTFGKYPAVRFKLLPLRRRWIEVAWSLGLPFLGARSVEYDLVFIPAHQYLPVKNTRVIGFVYDIVNVVLPVFSGLRRLWIRWNMRRFVRLCDTLISISEYTKEDVQKYYNYRGDVHVAYLGYRKDIFNTRPQKADEQNVQFSLDRPYVLYLGSLYPRRYGSLLEAFARARETLGDAYKLVMIGSREYIPRGGESIREKIQKLGIDELVVMTGSIPDEAVAAIMKNARLFVYPSQFEGFGIPPLEAMACGLPVITGNNTSLRELYAEAAWLIKDVNDPAELSNALITVLRDEAVRSRMVRQSIRLADQFSWEKFCARVEEIFLEQKSRGNVPD